MSLNLLRRVPRQQGPRIGGDGDESESRVNVCEQLSTLSQRLGILFFRVKNDTLVTKATSVFVTSFYSEEGLPLLRKRQRQESHNPTLLNGKHDYDPRQDEPVLPMDSDGHVRCCGYVSILDPYPLACCAAVALSPYCFPNNQRCQYQPNISRCQWRHGTKRSTVERQQVV